MPRHTVYLSESDNKILLELKEKHGSISNAIRFSLHKLREEQLRKYYTQKPENYAELQKAQKKVISRQEKEEQS